MYAFSHHQLFTACREILGSKAKAKLAWAWVDLGIYFFDLLFKILAHWVSQLCSLKSYHNIMIGPENMWHLTSCNSQFEKEYKTATGCRLCWTNSRTRTSKGTTWTSNCKKSYFHSTFHTFIANANYLTLFQAGLRRQVGDAEMYADSWAAGGSAQDPGF